MFGKVRLIAFIGVVLFAAVALGQVPPNTIFQLDGNAANSTSACIYGTPCDYWNLLNGTGNNSSTGGIGNGSSAGHSLVRTFVNGTASTDSFTGGGSKDANLINKWAYSTTPTPNKDTLNAAYAAAYVQNGDFEIIFGANRASNSGDANIGIWFFQQVVLPDGKGGFTGAHANGDVFIISAFTTGGVTSTISVYEWDSACSAGVKSPTPGQCADTNLRLLANPKSGICSTSAFCGITNPTSTASTWGGAIPAQLFFEGGIDITAAFNGIAPVTNCFASFLVETRSSASTSAVLKDFIGGGFPVCSLSITKTCGTPSIVAGGTKINYPVSGVVTNTGIGTLFNVSAFDTDTVAGTTSSAILVTNNTVVNNVQSPNYGTSTLGAGETGTWNSSIQTSASSASDTAYAQGGLSASVTPTGDSTQTSTVTSSTFGPLTCQNTVSSTLTVSKSCTTSLQAPSSSSGPVTVLVTYQGQVCNYGPSKVTGVVLTDTPLHGASATITVGDDIGPCTVFDSNGVCTVPICVAYPGINASPLTYTPTGIDQTVSGGTGPGRYGWTNDITITSATATVGSVSKISNTGTYCDGTYGCKSATCYICQSGQCTQ